MNNDLIAFWHFTIDFRAPALINGTTIGLCEGPGAEDGADRELLAQAGQTEIPEYIFLFLFV